MIGVLKYRNNSLKLPWATINRTPGSNGQLTHILLRVFVWKAKSPEGDVTKRDKRIEVFLIF
jgi:hypothetical protein